MADRRSSYRCISHPILLLAVALGPATADADTYPARPVRIVIGFTPGGVPDITARTISATHNEMKKLEPTLSDELHAQVTGVLVELSAYNIMRLLNELQAERARVAFGK